MAERFYGGSSDDGGGSTDSDTDTSTDSSDGSTQTADTTSTTGTAPTMEGPGGQTRDTAPPSGDPSPPPDPAPDPSTGGQSSPAPDPPSGDSDTSQGGSGQTSSGQSGSSASSGSSTSSNGDSVSLGPPVTSTPPGAPGTIEGPGGQRPPERSPPDPGPPTGRSRFRAASPGPFDDGGGSGGGSDPLSLEEYTPGVDPDVRDQAEDLEQQVIEETPGVDDGSQVRVVWADESQDRIRTVLTEEGQRAYAEARVEERSGLPDESFDLERNDEGGFDVNLIEQEFEEPDDPAVGGPGEIAPPDEEPLLPTGEPRYPDATSGAPGDPGQAVPVDNADEMMFPTTGPRQPEPESAAPGDPGQQTGPFGEPAMGPVSRPGTEQSDEQRATGDAGSPVRPDDQVLPDTDPGPPSGGATFGLGGPQEQGDDVSDSGGGSETKGGAEGVFGFLPQTTFRDPLGGFESVQNVREFVDGGEGGRGDTMEGDAGGAGAAALFGASPFGAMIFGAADDGRDVPNTAYLTDLQPTDPISDPFGSLAAAQRGAELTDWGFTEREAEEAVRSASREAAAEVAEPAETYLEGPDATRFGMSAGGGRVVGRRPTGGPVAAPGPFGATGTVSRARQIPAIFRSSATLSSGGTRTAATGSDVAHAVGKQGQFIAEGTESLIRNTAAATSVFGLNEALEGGEIEAPERREEFSNQEMEAPERREEFSNQEVEAPDSREDFSNQEVEAPERREDFSNSEMGVPSEPAGASDSVMIGDDGDVTIISQLHPFGQSSLFDEDEEGEFGDLDDLMQEFENAERRRTVQERVTERRKEEGLQNWRQQERATDPSVVSPDVGADDVGLDEEQRFDPDDPTVTQRGDFQSWRSGPTRTQQEAFRHEQPSVRWDEDPGSDLEGGLFGPRRGFFTGGDAVIGGLGQRAVEQPEIDQAAVQEPAVSEDSLFGDSDGAVGGMLGSRGRSDSLLFGGALERTEDAQARSSDEAQVPERRARPASRGEPLGAQRAQQAASPFGDGFLQAGVFGLEPDVTEPGLFGRATSQTTAEETGETTTQTTNEFTQEFGFGTPTPTRPNTSDMGGDRFGLEGEGGGRRDEERDLEPLVPETTPFTNPIVDVFDGGPVFGGAQGDFGGASPGVDSRETDSSMGYADDLGPFGGGWL